MSPLMYSHITTEEIQSLTGDESLILLYICNIWAPISPPVSSVDNPYPITLNSIRYANKKSIVDRVLQAEGVISDIGFEIYNGLRIKLGLTPLPSRIVASETQATEEPSTESKNNE